MFQKRLKLIAGRCCKAVALSIVFTIFSHKSWVLRQWYAFRDHLEVTAWTDVLAVYGAMKITKKLAAAATAKLREVGELNFKHCSWRNIFYNDLAEYLRLDLSIENFFQLFSLVLSEA